MHVLDQYQNITSRLINIFYNKVNTREPIQEVCFDVPVNSYGHVGAVSSPNHYFFLDKLHILSLVTDNQPYLNQRKGGE